MEYSEMNLQQRAEYLLGKGVEAHLGIDPEVMSPGSAAQVEIGHAVRIEGPDLDGWRGLTSIAGVTGGSVRPVAAVRAVQR